MPVMTKTPKGDDIVILSRKKYDQIVAANNEEAADAKTLRRFIARRAVMRKPLPAPSLFLAAKTPLAFFRKKRGLSQGMLAKTVGITSSAVGH